MPELRWALITLGAAFLAGLGLWEWFRSRRRRARSPGIDTATVMVDNQPRGTVSEIAARGGLQLERGLHRIEIAAEGFRTFRLELNLGEKREAIRVKLIRIDAKP